MQYTIKRVENKQYIEIKDLQNIIHKRLMTLIYKEQLQTAKKRANNNRKNIKQDIVYILSNSNDPCLFAFAFIVNKTFDDDVKSTNPLDLTIK